MLRESVEITVPLISLGVAVFTVWFLSVTVTSNFC
jgi:hypothetical protein